MRAWCAIVALLMLPCQTAASQWPPERATNLKVFPAATPVRTLVDTMASFTRALGVRCTYCHVGREGDPLEAYDFASDEKPAKTKAREMLRMVAAVNGEHLTKLSDRREPRIAVTCATCHRGVPEPRPLQQILLNTYDRFGADSVEAVYRTLRNRYYGAAAYDFGEVPLADVATALRRRGLLRDASRFYVLNTFYVPGSGFAHRQAAEGHLAVNDTTAAIGSLERALAINPNDMQARTRLVGLRGR